ncbi:MAG: Uma2 family endonuclease [Pyrinomonadaceae bacterium MAG19_C2-C3]|nr:Uma2 family endonuclease [Pyrinomonadaceae bacterium MAG19_C2-C3]
MSAQVLPLITAADLEAMPDDGKTYEIFEGELFMSRAPNLSHQNTIGNFYFQLRGFLLRVPLGQVFFTPGVIFDDLNSAIPDVAFVTNESMFIVADGKHIHGAPELLIEVISPGAENRRRDQVVKRQTYAKFGVKEYWIADAENRTIEVYRLRDGLLDLIAILTARDELTTPLLPDFSCRVTDIF